MSLAQSLPKHLSPDRFARIAITALTRTPKLVDCTQESLFRCLLDLSAAGLEPDGRHAHLIPYGRECTLILDYKGIVRLIRQSGEISVIHADVVYDNDEFEFSHGSGGKLIHRPQMKGDRGNPVCVYSYCRMKDGSEDFDVMTVDDVERIRRLSKAGNSGPWKDHWGEMAKKTVIRRHSKMLPLAFETVEAIEKADKGGEMKSANIPESDGSFFDEFSANKDESQDSSDEEASEHQGDIPAKKEGDKPDSSVKDSNKGAELLVSKERCEVIEGKMLDDAVSLKRISEYLGRTIVGPDKLTDAEADRLAKEWAQVKGGK